MGRRIRRAWRPVLMLLLLAVVATFYAMPVGRVLRGPGRRASQVRQHEPKGSDEKRTRDSHRVRHDTGRKAGESEKIHARDAGSDDHATVKQRSEQAESYRDRREDGRGEERETAESDSHKRWFADRHAAGTEEGEAVESGRHVGQFSQHEEGGEEGEAAESDEASSLSDNVRRGAATDSSKGERTGGIASQQAHQQGEAPGTPCEGEIAWQNGDREHAGADEASVQAYRDKLNVPLDEEIEQSSAKFTDFTAPDGPGWLLPALKEHVSPNDAPPCDPTDVTFGNEEACLAFLGDVRNWVAVKPLASILAKSRTIKYQVELLGGVRAMLKVSQYKFLYEPYSELFAFHVDRALNFSRVPPVAWVAIPTVWLQSASARMPAMYCQWVQKFVFDQVSVRKTIRPRCPFAPAPTIYVSVQLWVANVGSYAKSPLKVKHAKTLLSGSSSARSIEGEPGVAYALGEFSDLMVFDFIVGNNDRSDKNTFALPGQLVWLDNGSSFYGTDPPKGHPMKITSRHNASMCIFRKATLAAVRASKGTRLLDAVNARLAGTPGLWGFARPSQLSRAQARLNLLLKTFTYCAHAHPHAPSL
ncbi:Protein of unknown function (DUF1193) [Diplonema papillatum]|nr:Protein of unknown function (DUF1193) [Diplonema papillatum]